MASSQAKRVRKYLCLKWVVTNIAFSLDKVKDDVLENSNNKNNTNFNIAIDPNTINHFHIFLNRGSKN